MTTLFFIGRLLLGGFFVWSGIQHFTGLKGYTGYAKFKKLPMPRESVIVSGIMLLLGGCGIILGTNVKLSIFVLSIFLVITNFTMHTFWKEKDASARTQDQIGFNKNLALLGALLMMLMIPMPWLLAL